MYTAAIQDSHRVSWNEFYTAFHKHHIPIRTIHYILWEVLDLQQGTDTVFEYIRKFNYREQYSTHHIDTDEKKAELFRRGLSLPLQDRLVWFCDMPFNALVSVTIDHEGTCRALLVEEEKMRKRIMLRHSEDSSRGCSTKVSTSHDFYFHHHGGITTHLSSSRCCPRHLSRLSSLYHLEHLSRKLQ
jgi:hypothetical protein